MTPIANMHVFKRTERKQLGVWCVGVADFLRFNPVFEGRLFDTTGPEQVETISLK
jgi:hypothetical protein